MDARARAHEPRSCRAARAAASRRMSGGVQASGAYSADEMMTVTAARQLTNGAVCFVGIGLPSAACNLARRTHAPDLVLIYESGTVGARPEVLPLSIGDGELADTADCVVSLPEVFTHYRSEEHTSELQSRVDLVCRLLLEKKKKKKHKEHHTELATIAEQ